MQDGALREKSASEVKQLISFAVGSEQYGLEMLRVKEVIRMPQITWLPKAPACVKGIINLRGEVIPIVDLRERFGLQPRESNASTRVIVVEVDKMPVGMTVDSASQVVRIPIDQFGDPPPLVGEATRSCITSVGRMGEELVLVLDAERLLDAQELKSLGRSLGEVTQDATTKTT